MWRSTGSRPGLSDDPGRAMPLEAGRHPMARCEVIVRHWDGRLDNADDLGRQLGIDGDACDATVVRAAVGRWGVGAFHRLIGEWAAVLWTPPEDTLYLATDWSGSRPLFYRRDANGLRWSSELTDLCDPSGRMPGVSDDYVVSYVLHDPEPTSTPYRGIFGVPPGDVIVARGNCVTRVAGWRPSEGCIRYRRDTEYAEHFADLFREAVRARMPKAGIAMSELSGGLDSSSIVA